MSKIDLREFPKYLFTLNGEIIKSDKEYNKEMTITICYKNYMWVGYMDLIYPEGVRDVYDSIDYVEHFLELNGFIIDYGNSVEHISLGIDVYIGCDNYVLSTNNERFTYNSEELLTKLKEILDTESLNKLTSE
jgi:hypothetical protein